jgi:hypothetical protein
MNSATLETRHRGTPDRYFARYMDHDDRFLSGTYIHDDQIEMELGEEASKLAFETLSAYDRGEMTPEQEQSFIKLFGFTPERAHQGAHIEHLSGSYPQ